MERSTLLVPFAGTGFCGALAAGLGADLTTGFGAGFAGGLLAAIFLVGFGAGLLGAGLVDFLAGLEGFDMFDSRSLYVVCGLLFVCIHMRQNTEYSFLEYHCQYIVQGPWLIGCGHGHGCGRKKVRTFA